MERKSRAIILMMLLLMLSIPTMAFRKLTTTQIRENSIRINALELDEIDITKVKGPKEVTVVLDERSLLFDFDKSNVKPQYYGILQNLKEYIEVNDYDVTIIGHTDSKGTDAYNMALGMRRAIAVRDKLLEFGLDPSRILGVESRGESEPIATNDTEEGRFENRRIEFKATK